MKTLFIILVLTGSVVLLSFTNFSGREKSINVEYTLSYIRSQSSLFAESCEKLYQAINDIEESAPKTIDKAREALKECRLAYKRLEFFMTYFLNGPSLIYNQPNKVEVEEPFMETQEPVGLQVIEAMLFFKKPAEQKKELMQQADVINSSAKDIPALLYNLNIDDKQILESIRLELIRIISLGITGFDTPELKTGIPESAQALETIKDILQPFLSAKNDETDSLTHYLDISLYLLERNPDFFSFDRMNFLVNAALPLQYHLGRFIQQARLEINTTGSLNYDAANLFSPATITIGPDLKKNPALIDLGKQLFSDKNLSINNSRSCASCHHPDDQFIDRLPKSITLDGRSTVARNAPSLFYSTYQYAQFWDGRVKTLAEQILAVIENPREMGSDHKVVIDRLQNSKPYRDLFITAFPSHKDSTINMTNISLAIEAFLQTLAPFNSAFDRYIRGDKTALTKQQIHGFNLFMGKAQCGTCHYAPLFNGLVPPLYNTSELEVLGVTRNTNFKRPETDTDNGRFNSYPIAYYKGAFKTPTVRNCARTAPYMHNGAFATLKDVVIFYNKGGGAGMRLDIRMQTLSPEPLRLTKKEIRDIVSFLQALNEENYKF